MRRSSSRLRVYMQTLARCRAAGSSLGSAAAGLRSGSRSGFGGGRAVAGRVCMASGKGSGEGSCEGRAGQADEPRSQPATLLRSTLGESAVYRQPFSQPHAQHKQRVISSMQHGSTQWQQLATCQHSGAVQNQASTTQGKQRSAAVQIQHNRGQAVLRSSTSAHLPGQRALRPPCRTPWLPRKRPH